MKDGAPRGVTLVELVVALAITGVVLLAAHAALGAMVHGWERSRDARSIGAGAAARATLEHWLRAAVLSDSDATFAGRNAVQEGRDSDTLRMVVSDGGPLYPGAHRVMLWVEDDPRASRRGLLAVLSPWPDVHRAARSDTLVIAPAARTLDARYRVIQHGVERWADEWTSRRELPLAIALSIGLPPPASARDGASQRDALLAVPLLVSVAARRW